MSEILDKAKVKIVLQHPFYASLMMGLSFKENKSIKTACTDGVSLEYNPSFIASLTVNECVGLIIHEMMHIYLLHHTRIGARDHFLWNVAGDFVINLLIRDAGIHLPENGLISEEFRNMSTEQVYELLRERVKVIDLKAGGKGNNGRGLRIEDESGKSIELGVAEEWGEVKAPEVTREQLQRVEAETKHRIALAAQTAKRQGKLPGEVERLLNGILEPVVNWREVLASFIVEKTRDDYSFNKINKRYVHTGVHLPGLYSETLGEVVLVVDTSGSMSEELLKGVGAELISITETFNKGFTVIYCDTKVAGVQEIEPFTDEKLKPVGGGGTSFVAPFRYMEENGMEPKCVIYFTDGYCYDFPPAPAYSVLWTVYNNDSFIPPFGEVVKIKNEIW
ncbi:MAG: hypothetical protein J5I50_08085 [Chitinophagaceae bacterium]|nr:hypothetical protein [Chitinophagaceae bacterium]